MRGDDTSKGSWFSYIDLEKRVSADHPLRVIREIANAALKALSRDFDALYSPIGRESIPPERLLRALLLQAFYSIRSERQLVERIDYDLLFRWFVGLGIEDQVWDATTFTKNRDGLLDGEVAAKFLAALLSHDKVKGLLSCDHFSVDGTLLEAWASPKSFRPKDGSGTPPGAGRNGARDFHGERRKNDTHASTTDGDARLFRKGPGKEARLCFMGHALMENRHGLIVDAVTTRASGHAERLAAIGLIEPRADRPNRITLGADKAYDTADLSWNCANMPSPLMSRRTRAGGAQQSTGEPLGMSATKSPSASASASRKPLGGPKPSLVCARCAIAACPRSAGNSPWQWPPTISSVCPNCSLSPPRDRVVRRTAVLSTPPHG
jgi:transposase